MIDLRSNILDETDYGPQPFAESLEMCRRAVECGVKTVVATPRWRAGRSEPPLSFAEVNRKVERLQQEVGDTLSIKSGFVLEFSRELPELADTYGSRLALGTKQHLLISLPSTNLPTSIDDVWAGLYERGFLVLIAHPECSPAIRHAPLMLNRWAAAGLKFQVDAASVAGAYGREVKRFALECLQKFDRCAVVASNMRGTKANPMKDARIEISARMGEARAAKFVNETPTGIIGEAFLTVKSESRDSGKLSSLLRSLKQIKTLVGEA